MYKSIIFLFILMNNLAIAQTFDEDKAMLKEIYSEALTNDNLYENLRGLCKDVGHRPAGSVAYDKAVAYMISKLKKIKDVHISTQECQVEHWERGDREIVKIVIPYKAEIEMHATALGNSSATEEDGIISQVIEVKSLEQLEKLGKDIVKGKIVFFSRPMDPTLINTFRAYGGAVDQRVWGPFLASKLGAIGCIVRSMTLSQDYVPHTGVTIFKDGVDPIPALAISTIESDLLSEYLINNEVQIFINTNNVQKGKKTSSNVIAEIKGTEFPDEIILVGGHLDSWDLGEGAHDDGAGCVQAMEVLSLFRKLNYKPKRTIRCVLFANEEKGLDGAKKYAAVSNDKKERHIAAIESDAGGYTPRGFSMDAELSLKEQYFTRICQWKELLSPYLITLEKGGSGADINPLKSQKGILLGLRPDSQRYFDVHHSTNDVFERVNKRELQLGGAAICSLVYLIDKYGLE